MMLHYMHEWGIFCRTHLYNLGIRQITLRKYWKAERGKYIYRPTPLIDKPAPRVDHRYAAYRSPAYDTTPSIERIEAARSVMDYYLNRPGMLPIVSSAFLLWAILWFPVVGVL